MHGKVGRITAIWRYPVKSMIGEELDDSAVTEQGLLGDRASPLVDAETGKVASAKHPKRWRNLFQCHPALTEPLETARELPSVRIMLPDDATVTSDDPRVVTRYPTWSGAGSCSGDGVSLQLTVADPRCVMITLPEGDLPKDPGILRTAARHKRVEIPGSGPYPCVGVHATVAAGGSFGHGDPVALNLSTACRP